MALESLVRLDFGFGEFFWEENFFEMQIFFSFHNLPRPIANRNSNESDVLLEFHWNIFESSLNIRF